MKFTIARFRNNELHSIDHNTSFVWAVNNESRRVAAYGDKMREIPGGPKFASEDHVFAYLDTDKNRWDIVITEGNVSDHATLAGLAGIPF